MKLSERARAITAGLVVAAVLALAFVAILTLTNANQGRLDQQEVILQKTCEDDNELRAAEVTLWEGVIAISTPRPDENPAERARRAERVSQFRALLLKVFAPKDCTPPR